MKDEYGIDANAESYWLFFIYISPFLVFIGTANPQSLVCF